MIQLEVDHRPGCSGKPRQPESRWHVTVTVTVSVKPGTQGEGSRARPDSGRPAGVGLESGKGVSRSFQNQRTLTVAVAK
eukprot:3537175-Rhodomonas_salina.1